MYSGSVLEAISSPPLNAAVPTLTPPVNPAVSTLTPPVNPAVPTSTPPVNPAVPTVTPTVINQAVPTSVNPAVLNSAPQVSLEQLISPLSAFLNPFHLLFTRACLCSLVQVYWLPHQFLNFLFILLQ